MVQGDLVINVKVWNTYKKTEEVQFLRSLLMPCKIQVNETVLHFEAQQFKLLLQK